MKYPKFINRELSWLSFNYRVLQEAKNPEVPLYERIKFLAIFSSNLDEFFRVRVASLRSLLDLKKKSQEELKFSPEQLLIEIHETVLEQQEEFGKIYRESILPQLEKNNIFLLQLHNITGEDEHFLQDYFKDNIQQYVQPLVLVKDRIIPFLKNRRLYLTLRMTLKDSEEKKEKPKRIKRQYAMVEIPSDFLPRFIALPGSANKHRYIFLDDIVKYSLPEIFPAYTIECVYSVKLTRDAELYIEDEFTGNLLNKIKKSLNKRSTGVPSRFLYDNSMPKDFLNFLRDALKLSKDDMVAGAKYHNFNDFFSLPNPGIKNLEYSKLTPVRIKCIDNSKSIFDAIKEKDLFFYFPCHSYDYVLNFFEEAADDPSVTEIKLTQYRVADDSKIVKALIKAAKKGKKVVAFVELKARFDEESNIRWAEEMEKAGVQVFYSFPGLKVHAKLALIKRKEGNKTESYCYLGTGNFNEKTAKIYTDIGLMTRSKILTEEVLQVFDFLMGKAKEYSFKHLLVAQFNMKEDFYKLIDNEITNALAGKESGIILKMNSLEDKKMINKLYAASIAGVKIEIIVRGLCCLNPGVKGMSENIKVKSIIDRFLEHARIYIFKNGGKDIVYSASADWMKRNLSRRIEVAFPILDEGIKTHIKNIINIQLSDNQKARIIQKNGKLKYNPLKEGTKIRSQIEICRYLSEMS